MKLSTIEAQLGALPGLSVSLRGTGEAQFVYVRSATKAIEVCVEDKGLLIEYWNEACEESDARPVMKEVAASEGEAVDRIKKWLYER